MSPTLIVPLTIAAEGSLLHKFGDTHAPRAVFPTTTRTNPTIQQVETHEGLNREGKRSISSG